ncbi:MAG: hypothetical protein IPG66_06000 [Hydrogenophilales bacterium]|nr:hypothetical protein [Hydrogenophilales bacterium]
MRVTPEQEIERYLRHGEHDPLFRAWPGDHVHACVQLGDAVLRKALIAEVRSRTPSALQQKGLVGTDVVDFARRKVTPMVRGLFPVREQAAVLDLLANSVVLLDPNTIVEVLEQTPMLGTAWDLANLYLAGNDAILLSEGAPCLAGMSIGTTCYLSARYLDQSGHFDDFLIHATAHILHNRKRATIGLPETRRRPWLLEIQYTKRETFAYACEAYSRIRELVDGPKGRCRLLAELEEGDMPPDDRVDADEYLDILLEAVVARNGWKCILRRYASSESRSYSR